MRCYPYFPRRMKSQKHRRASSTRTRSTRSSHKVHQTSSVLQTASISVAPQMSSVHHVSSYSPSRQMATRTSSSRSNATVSRRGFSSSSTIHDTPTIMTSRTAEPVGRGMAMSQSFRPSHITRNYINPPNTIKPEAILNTPVPITPRHQLRSYEELAPVPEGQPIITGAINAPVRIVVGIEDFNPDTVDNKFELQPRYSKAFNADQLESRKIFLNAFPRTPASPAGQIIQTAYSNYPVYNQAIDWRNRLKFVPFQITVQETPDYTPYLDTRWYAEAMPRLKARVDLNIRNLFFLTELEKQVLGELLGPRYNWQTGKIALSCGNLRTNHANINRCFQWVHEATHRAIEIAPIIAESKHKDDAISKQTANERKKLQRQLNKELQPYTKHIPRQKATGNWLSSAQPNAQAVSESPLDEAPQQFM